MKPHKSWFAQKAQGENLSKNEKGGYVIIKAHNGDIIVETKEGEYAKFFIHLSYE